MKSKLSMRPAACVCALFVAASLSAKAVAPDRHFSRAMARNFELAIDFAIDFPEREVTARGQPKLAQLAGGTVK